MNEKNVQTWDKMYAEGRSLLQYPDETVIASLKRHQDKLQTGLDIGCGAGRHTIIMANMGIKALGIDSSESAIKYASLKADKLGLSNITFKNALVQELSISDNSMDIVIAWGLFHYLNSSDRINLLERVYSILRPGGILLCTLRSVKDTRISSGTEIDEHTYLVDYFDEETQSPKQTVMYFWDEPGVYSFLSRFSKVSLGHKIVEPINKLGQKSAHWLVEAYK